MDFTFSHSGEDRYTDHEVQVELCASQVLLTQAYNRKAYDILARVAAKLGKRQPQKIFFWSVFITGNFEWNLYTGNQPQLTAERCFSS